MQKTSVNQRITVIYLLTTIVVMVVVTQLGAKSGFMPIVLLGVISPMLLAMAFCRYEGNWPAVARLFAKPDGFRFNTFAFLCAAFLPAALMLTSIYIDTGHIPAVDYGIMLQKLPVLLVLMTGEEFGWRRYAFARLSERYSFTFSAVLVAVIWWLWHFPGYLIGMGTPEKMSFWLFGLMVLPGGILLAFLYRWTKNVYLVILAHVSSNMAFSGLPLLPEITGDSTAFVIYTGLLWLLILPLLLQRKYWKSADTISHE